MKKVVFEGKINDIKFDNREDFQKYMHEHRNDISSISCSVREEDSADDSSDDEALNTSLYPEFDIDELCTQPYTDAFDKTLDNKLEELKAALDSMSEEVLEDHLDNTRHLLEKYRDLLSMGNESIQKLEEDRAKLEEQLDNINHNLDTMSEGKAYLITICKFYREYERYIRKYINHIEKNKSNRKTPVVEGKQTKEQVVTQPKRYPISAIGRQAEKQVVTQPYSIENMFKLLHAIFG